MFRLVLGGSYLWFLFYIALFYVLAFAIRHVRPVWVAAAAFLISVLLLGAPHGLRVYVRLFYLMSFFFAGAVLGQHRTKFVQMLRNRKVLLLSPLVVAFAIAAAWFDWKSGPAFWPAAMAFVMVGGNLACRYVDSAWTRPIQFIGVNSLKFYVSHFPALYLFDMLASRLGVRSVGAVVPASIAAALITGYVLSVAAESSAAVRLLFSGPGRIGVGRYKFKKAERTELT